MPLGATVLFSNTGGVQPCQYPELAREMGVELVAGTYHKGQLIGETATPGLYAPYDPANILNNGATTATAKAIMQYGCVVDANHNVTAFGEFGATFPSMPAWQGGYFRIEDIAELDATAITALKGAINSGVLAIPQVGSLAQTGGTGTFVLTIPSFSVGTTSTPPTTYPAVVVSGINGIVTAANFVIAVNAALAAAKVPAWITATGGALGTNPIVPTFHGALAGAGPITLGIDNTGMSGGTVVDTPGTAGVAGYGIVRF